MLDPRSPDPTAPRGRDPLVTDPGPYANDPLERDRTGGAMWGWIAGIAVLILIAFILVGGWGWGGWGGGNTAANAPAHPSVTTTGTAPAAR